MCPSNANQTPSDLEVMSVRYRHLALDGGDDLYLTAFGQPLADLLQPANYWTDRAWFMSHHKRLSGTSMVYRIETKPGPWQPRSIVLKWNRMGQDVPGATMTQGLTDAEFNSPFEEFALVFELRNTRYEGPGGLLTHKPLAIYVPRGHVEPERLGRKAYRMEALADSHDEHPLDLHRNYAVIYEWIDGLDLAEAVEAGLIHQDAAEGVFHRVCARMADKGFEVADNKLQHVIVRPDGEGGLVRGRDGEPVWATIDFELLRRTPQREQAVRHQKRKRYLVKQAHRFEAREECPPHLHRVNLLGVDYVFGNIESTGGALWVVGRDPGLFDYFLPEKWRRTARTRLSVSSQIYETVTKDNIHLVWKVSRVGEIPDMDPFKADEKRILDYGYNSPFEEVALNLELTRRGIATTYPRAIYMTGSRTETPVWLADSSRYVGHGRLKTPDGRAILRANHDYMIIWGYWNGPDELLAVQDRDYYKGVNALQAWRQGLIDQAEYVTTMDRVRQMLLAVGIEDLNFRGNHILLSIDQAGHLVREADGTPAVRICSFELLRRVQGESS